MGCDVAGGKEREEAAGAKRRERVLHCLVPFFTHPHQEADTEVVTCCPSLLFLEGS